MHAYLKENRLGDVLAAIQTMGKYKFYKLDFKGWADRISGSADTAEHWKTVFREHPEFFRLDSGRGKASLVLRRQHPKRYDVDQQKEITREEFYAHPDKSRISRSPLDPAEIAQLMETAIKLHAHALENRRDSKVIWNLLIPAVASLVGAFIGSGGLF